MLQIRKYIILILDTTPISNTTKYQKGPYYSGIKIVNHLPENIKKTIKQHSII
jgi:hypothetical protein